eukprot:scaffold95586_cov70-Phaeocystis_antarctica.AAC.2
MIKTQLVSKRAVTASLRTVLLPACFLQTYLAVSGVVSGAPVWVSPSVDQDHAERRRGASDAKECAPAWARETRRVEGATSLTAAWRARHCSSQSAERQRPRGKSCVGWARARPAPPVAAFGVALQGLLPRGRGNEGSRDEGGAPCQSLKCPCCIVTTFSAGREDRERIGTMAEAPREQPGTMRIATAIATGQCGTGMVGQARAGADRC